MDGYRRGADAAGRLPHSREKNMHNLLSPLTQYLPVEWSPRLRPVSALHYHSLCFRRDGALFSLPPRAAVASLYLISDHCPLCNTAVTLTDKNAVIVQD